MEQEHEKQRTLETLTLPFPEQRIYVEVLENIVEEVSNMQRARVRNPYARISTLVIEKVRRIYPNMSAKEITELPLFKATLAYADYYLTPKQGTPARRLLRLILSPMHLNRRKYVELLQNIQDVLSQYIPIEDRREPYDFLFKYADIDILAFFVHVANLLFTQRRMLLKGLIPSTFPYPTITAPGVLYLYTLLRKLEPVGIPYYEFLRNLVEELFPLFILQSQTRKKP